MIDIVRTLVVDDTAAAGVEYGLLVALIAAVIVGAVSTLGVQIQLAFTNLSAALGAP